MSKILDKVLLVPAIWRLSIFIMTAVMIVFLFYQHLFSPQTLQVDHYDSQLLLIESRLKNYLENRDDIAAEKKLFATQEQKLSSFEDRLETFNRQAPELALLLVARDTKVKLQEVQVSTILDDEFGQYYLVEIVIKNNLQKISQFLTNLISQPELAVWQQLTINRHVDEFNLTLATRFYVGLFDKASN